MIITTKDIPLPKDLALIVIDYKKEFEKYVKYKEKKFLRKCQNLRIILKNPAIFIQQNKSKH